MGKIDVYHKTVIENQKKRKYGNQKVLRKSPSMLYSVRIVSLCNIPPTITL